MERVSCAQARRSLKERAIEHDFDQDLEDYNGDYSRVETAVWDDEMSSVLDAQEAERKRVYDVPTDICVGPDERDVQEEEAGRRDPEVEGAEGAHAEARSQVRPE